jgi:hypothetical protein
MKHKQAYHDKHLCYKMQKNCSIKKGMMSTISCKYVVYPNNNQNGSTTNVTNETQKHIVNKNQNQH